MEQKLTFKQRMELEKLYELRRERTRKRNIAYIKDVQRVGLKIAGICYTILLIICKTVVVSVLAYGSQPIIYVMNKSLGEGYSIFASYALAGLLWSLIPDFWRNKK